MQPLLPPSSPRGTLLNQAFTDTVDPQLALQRHALVFDLIADPIVVTDGEGRVTDLNPAAERLFGCGKREALGRRATSLHALAAPGLHEEIGRALRATGRWTAEMRLPAPDGTERIFDVAIVAIVGADGTTIGAIGVYRDSTERRRTEEAFRETEARFQAVYEQAAVGITIADVRNRTVRANRFFCEMLGYDEAELARMQASEITHPDDLPAQRDRVRRLLAGELRWTAVEKRYVRKDGGIVWARVTISVVRDAAGAPQHFIAVAEDISERRRAETALRASEERYERIAANAPGMVYQFVLRPDGTMAFPFVSEGARSIYQVDPQEIARDASRVLGAVHPEDRASFEASVRQSAVTLEPWSWEGRVVLHDGEEKWLQGASRPERQPDGSILWDGLVVDITEQRRAARRLEESEQRYRSLFQHNPDAVFSFDVNGIFLSANPACEVTSGYRPEELVGTSFAPLVVPEQLEGATAHFRAAAQGAAMHYRVAIRHKSGRLVDLDVTNIPIVVGGEIVGVFGIAKDCTAQRELEAQLRQAQKMEAVGRLAAGVAHDFNNLLTVIESYGTFVDMDLPPDSPLHADVAEIRRAAARAGELTRQLLAFGRKQVLQPRLLDANEHVANVAAMLRRVIGEDVALETALVDDAWPVYADPGQLEQVLMNLAVNARDAMPEGGTLRLQSENVVVTAATPERPGLVPGAYVSLAVEDSGTGIAPDVLPKIFEPFFTTKGRGSGTGLGLSTAYGIVKQSGGFLYVDSVLGEGSRFTVLLPRAARAAERVDAGAAIAACRGRETVLLVEDEAAVRAAVRRMLEQQGFAVREAVDGGDAIAIASRPDERLDLVLTDVVMPNVSGRAVAEAIATARPGLRVLFMSGYADDEILRRGLMDSGAAFLEKPFSAECLGEAIRRVLDHRAS